VGAGMGGVRTCGRGRVNKRDQGEAIWLIGFIYLYKKNQRNLSQLL
jgi:hypothetical protein